MTPVWFEEYIPFWLNVEHICGFDQADHKTENEYHKHVLGTLRDQRSCSE